MSEPSPSPTPSPPAPALPPGAERRRLLRRQRRNERLRDLWRLLVYTAIAAGMGYVLLRQGWSLRVPAQVEVLGSSLVSRDQVIEAAGLHFPQPLLAIQPRELSRELAGALPVEQVRVTRLMLPPRLRVELVDRQAVARAERHTPSGLEMGYVDRLGNWISNRQNLTLRTRGTASIRVVGWNDRHRLALASVLEASESFGPGLQEIRFEPDGSLWLTTRELGSMRLGPIDGSLQRRLEVAAHLNRTLPAQLRGRRPRLIDLSDPEQPELSLPGALSAAASGGPGDATPPPGRQ